MVDVKFALEDLKEESDSGRLASSSRSKPQAVLALGATLAVVAWFSGCGRMVAVWFGRSTTKVQPEAPLTAVPLTSYPGEERQPSFSPDGNQVAFSWNGEKQDNFDIYVKLIGSGNQLRLTTAPEADSCLPGHRTAAPLHLSAKDLEGKLSVYLVSPLGPPERKVAEISRTGIDWPRGLAWTPDGKSLVVTDRNSDNEPLGLFLLSVESGEKRRLTSPERKGLSIVNRLFRRMAAL